MRTRLILRGAEVSVAMVGDVEREAEDGGGEQKQRR